MSHLPSSLHYSRHEQKKEYYYSNYYPHDISRASFIDMKVIAVNIPDNTIVDTDIIEDQH